MSFFTMKRISANVLTSVCYPHIQNGVGDNSFLPGSATGFGDNYAIAKLNSENELDLDDESSSRFTADPGEINVKPVLLDSCFSQNKNEDGFLPLGSVEMPEFPANPSGNFEKETLELIETLYRIHTGDSRPTKTNIKALSTMKRVVEKLIEKHHFAYNGMILKLSLDQQKNSIQSISLIAKSMFSDGTTNWGRIASLLAFGAVVCKHLNDSGREHCVPLVSLEISSYLLSDQRDWLLKNKAWEGFVEFFREEDPESAVRCALMAFAGVAGIGAGLAFLVR